MSTKPIKRVGIEFASDHEADVLTWGGFLKITRHRMRNCYDDGTTSKWYWVETAHPPFVDAVVLVLYAVVPGQPPSVYLRRSLRPAVAVRRFEPLHYQVDGKKLNGELWEIPAGGIEPGDLEPGGPGRLGRAVAEALEEAGLKLEPGDLTPLGPPQYTAPAVTGERLYFYHAKVDPQTAQEPCGDGHPMEDGSELSLVPLPEALEWVSQGKICDLKSEVGLMRLARLLQAKSGVPFV